MKYKFILILAVLLVTMYSCNKEIVKQKRIVECTQLGDYAYLDNYNFGLPCISDSCKAYQAIWKELFLEKNNINQDYFDNHIVLCNSSIDTWNDGISFRICYKIKIDWAIAYNCDQFIIKINGNNGIYPTLNLPRNVYLSKSDISKAINFHAFSSDLINLSNIELLKFNSLDNALQKLITDSKVNTLCSNRIFVDNISGHIMLEAHATYINEFNSCITGTIDLINGNTVVMDVPCWIN